jgi:hypothetical protein
MYAMVVRWPDIVHVVFVLSRFMHNFGRLFWNAAKHIFRYLVGTEDYDVTFRPDKLSSPVGFTDLNYAGCYDNWMLVSISRFGITSFGIASLRESSVWTRSLRLTMWRTQ